MRRRDDAEFHEPTHTDFEVTTLGDERVVKRSRFGDEMLMPVTERSPAAGNSISWLCVVGVCCCFPQMRV